MITYTVRCDHPDCPAAAVPSETPLLARRAALEAGWQRWRPPLDDELLDLCPAHHQPVRAKVQTWSGAGWPT